MADQRTGTITVELPTLAATEQLAHQLAEHIVTPMAIALNGTLGAGKTQLVRYLVDGLGGCAQEVTSPTYVLLQTYVGRHKIYHLDFYRLVIEDQVWDLGIDELYEQKCVVVIEWADKFPECLPEDFLQIELSEDEYKGNGRVALLAAHGPRAEAWLATIFERRCSA